MPKVKARRNISGELSDDEFVRIIQKDRDSQEWVNMESMYDFEL